MSKAETVAIRVYFRGKPEGQIRHIPARFFRWHPAYHGRKSYTAGGSSLGGQLERARDAYVNKIAPGNVGWEEVYSSTHYEKAARTNPAGKARLHNWVRGFSKKHWDGPIHSGCVKMYEDGGPSGVVVVKLPKAPRPSDRCVACDNRMDGRRDNPGIGMPGMPHTWVTKSGVHVSGGDTVEYWSKEGLARDAKPERRRAKVNRMLVFSDHVVVSRGQFGNYVSDDNFIRVVRKGG